MTNPKNPERAMTLILGMIFLLALAIHVTGVPQGANVLTNTTEGAPVNSPDSRADDGGTITVLTIDTTQQDQAWKAYVGNVSGRLTLDDVNGNTIYDWQIVATDIEGELYVSRNDSVVWSNISCANQTTVDAEQTLLNMVSSDTDSINSTFNYTNHSAMQVGINPIGLNTCRSTATYINDTAQAVTNASLFQEILLQDQNLALVYATFLEQDASGYKAGAQVNVTYDFQILIGEDDQAASGTTYYFYLEIS